MAPHKSCPCYFTLALNTNTDCFGNKDTTYFRTIQFAVSKMALKWQKFTGFKQYTLSISVNTVNLLPTIYVHG